MSALVAALRLLTVIPVPWSRDLSARSVSRSAAFFPLVGLGIGGAMAGLAWLALFVMPPIVAAGLAMLLGVVLTGALHLDGLADTADGLFGGRTPARRLEIMRDPHTGVFGVVAIGLALLLKLGGISALADGHAWAAVVLTPMLGRLAAVAVMAAFTYVRPEGLGTPYTAGARLNLLIAGATSAAAVLALLGPWGLVGLAGAVASGLAAARYAASRLGGGVTGDVYGAAVETGEIAALLSFTGLAGAGLTLAPVWA